ncbi:hypothetical protein B0H14DRAFT_3886084 [Mycena olivaceomarginata]|nr:hypothetical protein B0H14DRAFT_3886084 [Mycena olivaceomarginata]
MVTTTMRPPAAKPTPSRAAQRKQRSNGQRLSLFLSFRSVKFEWSDLDGMRFIGRLYILLPRLAATSQAARSPCLHSLTRDPIPACVPPPGASLLLVPRAGAATALRSRPRGVRRTDKRTPRVLWEGRHDLRAVAVVLLPHILHLIFPFHALHTRRRLPDVTQPIRICARAHPHTNTDLGLDTPPPMRSSIPSPPVPVRTGPAPGGKPRSSARGSGGACEVAVSILPFLRFCILHTPRPPRYCLRYGFLSLLWCASMGRRRDDEDAWVDEDDNDDEEGDGEEDDEDGEMPIVDDREEEGDEELPTPVPWCSELLAPQRGGGEEPQTPVPYSYEREATPAPYTREEEREGGREGEQVGEKRKR